MQKPFSLIFGPLRICYIVSVEDSEFIHKSSNGFHVDHFSKLAAGRWGVSKHGVEKIWYQSDPSQVSLFRELMNAIRKELSTFAPDGLPAGTLGRMWMTIPSGQIVHGAVVRYEDEARVVSLSLWIR